MGKVCELLISGRPLRLEVADSYLRRAIGLSFRANIQEDGGMLFVFRRPSRKVFWMFGMRFAIDVVWLREGAVVGLVKNIRPVRQLNFFNIFSSPTDTDMVLELKSGAIDRLGIRVDDKIPINI